MMKRRATARQRTDDEFRPESLRFVYFQTVNPRVVRRRVMSQHVALTVRTRNELHATRCHAHRLQGDPNAQRLVDQRRIPIRFVLMQRRWQRFRRRRFHDGVILRRKQIVTTFSLLSSSSSHPFEGRSLAEQSFAHGVSVGVELRVVEIETGHVFPVDRRPEQLWSDRMFHIGIVGEQIEEIAVFSTDLCGEPLEKEVQIFILFFFFDVLT